jgi:hypothetical protein
MERSYMHPSLAFWIWSIAICRAWQLPIPLDNRNTKTNQQPSNTTTPALYGSAICYGAPKVDWPLPANILDTSSELHWLERDSKLAV